MKDEMNTMFASIAWIRPDEVVPQANWNTLQPMPMTYISAVPRDITPRQLIVVTDKIKAAPTENVTLTATGCDYGRVVWKAGTNVIQDPNASITTITRQGPGIYQAMCTGDYNVVQDWVTVKVDITTEVLPIIPAIAPVCANGSVNLSISNPQAGLQVRWLWVKDAASQEIFNQFNSSGNIFVSHPQLFNSVNAASTTQTGPRTYWVQFFSINDWTSPPKPVIVAPYFVENIKATNNSPIESGGTLTLSTGVLTGATYAWTGPNAFSSTLRSPSISNFDANIVGTYSLTITAPSTAGSCNATYTTDVTIANCDIYIKATNPAAANAETYQLPRKTGGSTSAGWVSGAEPTNPFDPLTLKVEPLEGTANFSAYDVTWMLNGNPMTGSEVERSRNPAIALTTSQIGEYVAILSLKRNPATTCQAKVNINAIPCKTFTTNVNCRLPVIVAPPQGAVGVPLAAGDVFTAGDYKVTITEITSGSPSGYTGKGYVEQMKLIRIGGVSGAEPTIAKKVAVTLENTVVNDCYELAGGKVVSAYDANWGNVIDVDGVANEIKNGIQEILNIKVFLMDKIEIFDCSQSSINGFNTEIGKFTTFKTNIVPQFNLSLPETNSLISSITNITDIFTCKIQQVCGSTNSRIANISNCDYQSIDSKFDELESKIIEAESKTFIVYQVSFPNPAEAKNLNDARINYGNFGSLGKSKEGDDWENVGINLKPVTSSGIEGFAEIVTEWVIPTASCGGGPGVPPNTNCIISRQNLFNSLKSNLICPASLTNLNLLEKMSFPFNFIGLINHWNLPNYPVSIFERYQENKTNDYYFPLGVESLIYQSNKGKELIKNIVKLFHNTIKEKGVNYENTLMVKDENGNANLYNIHTPSFLTESRGILFALMGGTQHIRVLVKDFNKTNDIYSTDIIIQLMDDFGANEDDWNERFNRLRFNNFNNFFADFKYGAGNTFLLNKPKEALLAFWILQNQRNFKPFRTISTFKITINHESTNKFAK